MNRHKGLASRPIVVGALAVLFSAACAGNQARLREEALRAAAQTGPVADAGAGAAIDGDTVAPVGGDAATAAPGADGPRAAGATTAASGPTAVRSHTGASASGPSAGAATGTRVSGPTQAAAGGSAVPRAAAAAGGTTGGGGGANPGAGSAAGPANPGPTDIGVTGDRILVGGVWFHESYLDRYSRVSEHAVRAFFNDINRAGGVFGRKIDYVTCIDGGDSSRARACFKDLVENKKVFMLGPSATFSTGTIQEYVKAQKIPFVGSYGLYLEEYKNDNRYSFPSQVPVFEIARLFGKFLIEEVKPKTVGISYLNIEAAQECMKGLESYLSKAGVPVVAKVSNEFDEPDLTPQVLKMRQANPDIVAFCNDPLNNAKFVGVAARSQRYKPPKGWIGGWPTVPEFGKIVGDWGIGHYGFSSVCYHEAPECDANPDVRLFKAQMARQYPGEMERMHYYGQNLWCGAKMIVEALKLAGPNLTREGLLTALDSGAFYGWTCQDMQLYFKAGLRAGSRVGQMHQLDDKLRWRLSQTDLQRRLNMEYAIAGVFLGALYAVLAGGLVLVYRVSKVLNFAAGALGTVSAFIYWQMTEEWGWAARPAAVAAVGCGVAISATAGVAIDHASRRYGRAEATAATAGLMLFLVAGSIWVWGAGLRTIGSVVPGGDTRFDLGNVNITGHQLATIVWGGLYALLLHLWLRRTDSGLALRAMSEDDEVAVLHGVRPLRMAALAWGAAGLGSAVAGILISHISTLDPVSLTFQTVPAFVGAAVGVLRRFGLAYLGAIGLGVLYGVLGPYTAQPGVREVIAFVLLSGTLLVLSARARPGEVF